ncbi:DNA repair protein RecN [Spelaeicoccus albus]|uniref:DNA repair protein RecN n=1 Tax=Spelaeicoccus albus TaxID=1280376 RepID=A0A7Z0IJ20_9MICO|nr:DNA repair protein RecN [Spelaeicoccus albus]NYI69095.1 DNA repair protein RecN (Recombination protein N) [Spelaeicoccus albus]
MIEELTLHDLGVISSARIDLGAGLTVVTGETGAGKTMVVTALGLLLGARADAGAVRAGADQAVVDGRIRLTEGTEIFDAVAGRIDEAGGSLDDDTLVMSRSVQSTGRSKGHAGGRSVPAGVLADLGDKLVTVHGQSDQLRLKSAASQRELLDRFAGDEFAATLGDYREKYDRLSEVHAELRTLRDESASRAREADMLRFGIEEIDTVNPEPGEDNELKARSIRLSHTEELRQAAQLAHDGLTGSELAEAESAASLAGAAARALDSAGAHDDQLAALAERCRDLEFQASDIAGELSGYIADFTPEGPEELEQMEARRAELSRLTRKYGEDIDTVLDWRRSAGERLEGLDGDDYRIDALAAEQDRLESDCAELAGILHESRTKAAARLAAAVDDELAALAMPDATLHVDVAELADLTASGKDAVSILLAPHAGTTPRELAKGASGGELSRVMLAIEVVIAGSDPVPTLVFDEVDAGVGGKAAVEIGRRLARLARTAQVFVVTHLPQVAAWADTHIAVRKNSDAAAGVTTSDVTHLDESGRQVELARMLAGQEGSRAARDHAAELLRTAAAGRAQSGQRE